MASERLGYRIAEIARQTGLGRATVERELVRQSVRRKRFGRAVLFDPVGVEHVFGFGTEAEENAEPSTEALEIAKSLLA